MAIHDDILTLPEVAGLLKVALRTVYDLAQKGDLPAFKVGAVAVSSNGYRSLDRGEDPGCWRATGQ